jgi:hypothetical protein
MVFEVSWIPQYHLSLLVIFASEMLGISFQTMNAVFEAHGLVIVNNLAISLHG